MPGLNCEPQCLDRNKVADFLLFKVLKGFSMSVGAFTPKVLTECQNTPPLIKEAGLGKPSHTKSAVFLNIVHISAVSQCHISAMSQYHNVNTSSKAWTAMVVLAWTSLQRCIKFVSTNPAQGHVTELCNGSDLAYFSFKSGKRIKQQSIPPF